MPPKIFRPRARLRDQLLVPGDDLGGADVGGRSGDRVRRQRTEPEVVDAFQHDDVTDARLVQGVPLEPRLGVDAAARRVVQHPVPADALVGDRQRAAVHGVKPAGQVVGPAGVGADRGPEPVGYRVAERHHGARHARWPDDNVADVRPGLGLGGEGARTRVCGVVTGLP